MADSYFVKSRIGQEAELEEFFTRLVSASRRLIVVIPPSENRFQAIAGRVAAD